MIQNDEGSPRSCGVQGCTRPVVAKGLCIYHYKRQRIGKPLVDEGPRVGEKSGHGLYGIVTRDENAVLCHECGQWFASVAGHIGGAHGLTGREYKARHGIPARAPLVSLAQSRVQSEAAKARVGGAAWQRLEAARDPVAASHARTSEAFVRRGPDKQVAAQASRDNGSLYQGKPHPCPVCGAVVPATRTTCSAECHSRWLSTQGRSQGEARRRRLTPAQTEELLAASLTDPGPVIRQLQAEGIYSADIARVLRISPATMARRWPLDKQQRTERSTRTATPTRRGRPPRPLVEAHPYLAAQWDHTRNTMPVDQVTARTPGVFWWVCPTCGRSRQTTILSRINHPGSTCHSCRPRPTRAITKPLTDHRPDLAEQWHPILNDLRLGQIGTGTKRSVWWLCPDCGQSWRCPVVQRVRDGRSCPHCRALRREARREREQAARLQREKSVQGPSPGLTPEQITYLGDWTDIHRWTSRAIELRVQGVTLAAMARHYQVGVPTISRRMSRHEPDKPARLHPDQATR